MIGTINTLESPWYLGYLFLKPRNWKTMGRDDPSASFDGMTYYCHHCHYTHVPTKSIPERGRGRERERESHQGNNQHVETLPHHANGWHSKRRTLQKPRCSWTFPYPMRPLRWHANLHRLSQKEWLQSAFSLWIIAGLHAHTVGIKHLPTYLSHIDHITWVEHGRTPKCLARFWGQSGEPPNTVNPGSISHQFTNKGGTKFTTISKLWFSKCNNGTS